MNENSRESASRRATAIASNVDSKALLYVLEVLCLAWFECYSRSEAQKEIASRHGISKETVMDSFSERRGGVTQSELDRLLEEPDLNGLEQALLMRFKEDPRASNPIRAAMIEMRCCKRAPVFPGAVFRGLNPKQLATLRQDFKSSWCASDSGTG